MRKMPTWCTQLYDRECTEENCCLNEAPQNESHSKWIGDNDNKKDKNLLRNILNEK